MKFAIYKYELVKTNTKELFQENKSIYDNAQVYFGNLFNANQLNLYQVSNKDGLPQCFPNSILKTRNGVTLMRVCNVKHVTLWQDYHENKEESNPYCFVIIDNRFGIGQIAIERSGAFDSNTDKVRDILQESFHAVLAPLGFSIEIRAKVRTRDFWEAIEEQMTQKNERIQKVVFEFPNPDKVGPVDASPVMTDRLRFLASLASATGAARSSFKVDADKEGTLTLDRTKEDLAQMVALCCNNGYHISVHFEQFGVYRNGDVIRALYNIDKGLLDDFINGQSVLGDREGTCFGLINKLDYIREQTKEYENITPVKEGRKRKYRRAV